ncbi:MAG: Zn-dependent hydrolase [Methylobacteriaceae bacterium]|nr:Zn-dependent hydrolase [Methylobacteriaceae bacterium]
MTRTNLRVDPDRLWATIHETAVFGGTPKGGVRRLALSEEDRLVRDWFAAAVRDAGLDLAIDRMGTMYATRPGRDMSRPPIAFGSHLDTQPTGGKFDGVLGVLAGLEVMRLLDEAGLETEAPLVLVNWTNEEGARFAPGMIASGVYAGELDLDWALDRRDRDGIRFADALDAIGYRGEEPVGARRFGAMVELHIEQGPILEAERRTIGVVTAAKGSVWCDGRIVGRESHAGSTPMAMRRDALPAFAELALALEAIALEHGPDGVGTIGVVEALPASRNTIPGEIRFTLEYRHPEAGPLKAMGEAVDAVAAAIAERRGVTIGLERIWNQPPVHFDPRIAGAVETAATELGLPNRRITSGAGHDAVLTAAVTPTAMIFVPCRDGISHNETESATKEDCAAGADVLLRTVVALANAEKPTVDWTERVRRVIEHLYSRERVYDRIEILALVDDLVRGREARRDELAGRHGADFVTVALGHVTAAIHGKGPVPTSGGWYRLTERDTYQVEPGFAEAWRSRRRLS